MSRRHDHAGPAGAITGESLLGASTDASVVLEIGGTIGAIVLHAPPELAGAEIDITSLEGSIAATHSAVRERRLASGSRWAAVYPSLPEGRYVLGGDDLHRRIPVTVIGGKVTDVTW